jgi:hypothetical protein
MYWTRFAIGAAVGLFLLAASIQPASAQLRDNRSAGSQSRRTSHDERDNVTGAIFSAGRDGQGNARFAVSVNDFGLEKILAPSGDATIRLTQGQDVVTVVINHNGYVVERGERTAQFDLQSGQAEDFDLIRSVLLGSRAVGTFRRLAASLEDRDDDQELGPLMLGTLVDGAIVQLLDGDSGAPGRIGKRITRKQRAAIRRAKQTLGDILLNDCVQQYELALLYAWDLYQTCRDSAAAVQWYLWYFADALCETEWLLRSQQYLYQFMACFS